MAKLDKNLIRETTVVVDSRPLMVTLGADQTLSLKCKGLKSGEVSITLQEIWDMLNPKDSLDVPVESVAKDDSPMIPLYDIRSRMCVTLPPEIISRVDPILSEFVMEHKRKLNQAIEAKRTKKKATK